MSNSDQSAYYFHQGTNYRSYEYLGCTVVESADEYRYTFRVWAPSANSVGVVGDFCGWEAPIEMHRITNKGVWETTVVTREKLDGRVYKYRIRNGARVFLKGDPYASFSRGRDDGASIIYHSSFYWTDDLWLKHRSDIAALKKGSFSLPINIYELHFGSFLRHSSDNRYLSYRELADQLIPYLKYMGYTHVELLPLTEFPFDGSWGYQVCAFFAPTSRFGTPDDFRYFVNALHMNGIGVIMDWVPAHFPKDEWGLYEFDGTPLYEYQGLDRQESETWGTRFFDLGREEVQSFLISSAALFLREFHVDGLRVDAVASMIYLDYDRKDGEWIPNSYGGKENLEAIAFLRKLNTHVRDEFPDVLMIAEESGSFGGITASAEEGGLGFDLKWNMGFSNDLFNYVSTDPVYRKYKHKALNFPIMYAFSERYVLPISHDEVVHGKKSFLDKMNGSYEDKFSQFRSTLLLMMTYPGKKLLFMGCEFGQFREWDYENSLEWFMLDYPAHKALREYTASLNRFYLEHKELWDLDFDPSGFMWFLADEADKNSIVYSRLDSEGSELTVAVNFSGVSQRLAIKSEMLVPIFDTGIAPNITRCDLEGIVEIELPAFSGAIFKRDEIKIKI